MIEYRRNNFHALKLLKSRRIVMTFQEPMHLSV